MKFNFVFPYLLKYLRSIQFLSSLKWRLLKRFSKEAYLRRSTLNLLTRNNISVIVKIFVPGLKRKILSINLYTDSFQSFTFLDTFTLYNIRFPFSLKWWRFSKDFQSEFTYWSILETRVYERIRIIIGKIYKRRLSCWSDHLLLIRILYN